MCTLVIFRGSPSRRMSPLVIAANRDENPARVAAQPSFISPDTFAPIDLKRGGTWIGVNRHGITVAITNRDPSSAHKGCRSRGLLVTDCLNATSHAEALETIMRVNPVDYNGFHIVIADASRATLVINDGKRITRGDIGLGMHVITSFGAVPGHSERDLLIRDRAYHDHDQEDADLDQLLSFHGPGPEDGTCAHGEGVTMESVFSMTVRLPPTGGDWRIRWRNGRPCEGGDWFEETVPIIGS